MTSNGPVMAQVRVFEVVPRSRAMRTSATLKIVKVKLTDSRPNSTDQSRICG